MPFTFSHPAIVLPLTKLPKRWYSLTGLVIGSMAPDFEYFIRMGVLSKYSHSLLGILYFDIPVGLIISFIFHLIVRNILIINLPVFLRTHFMSYISFNWVESFKQNWLIIILSIITGTCSHIFWDGFTHSNGFFVRNIPFLSHSINMGKIVFPLFKVLQHSSTIIGLILIIYYIKNLPTEDPISPTIDLKYWVLIVITTFLVMLLRSFAGLNFFHPGYFAVVFIAAFLAAIIIVSGFYMLKTKS